MKYQGKRRLYEFLKSHGYEVPKLSEMEYSTYRGSEWLKSLEIEVYARSGACVFVTTYEYNEEGERKEKGYVSYRAGEAVYKTERGKRVV